MKYQKIMSIALSLFLSYAGLAEENKAIQSSEIQSSQTQQRGSMNNGSTVVQKTYERTLSDLRLPNERNVFLQEREVNADNIAQICINFLNSRYEKHNINTSNLKVNNAEFVGNRWHITFGQVYNGLDVYGGGVKFTLLQNGRLQHFQSTFYNDINLSTVPVITPRTAETVAVLGLSKPAGNYHVKKNEQLLIFPYMSADVNPYRLVYVYSVSNFNENYTAYVDAKDGTLLIRTNNTVNNYDAQVKGDVYPENPNDPMITTDIRYCEFNVDGKTYKSTATGLLSLPDDAKGKPFTTNLNGSYAKVRKIGYEQGGEMPDTSEAVDYQYNGTIDADGNINMLGKSDAPNYDEIFRTIYNNINTVHDYHENKFGFLNLSKVGQPMKVYAQILPDNVRSSTLTSVITINARATDSTMIDFYSTNHKEINIGILANVAYHEYAHAVTSCIYGGNSILKHMITMTGNEAVSDVTAAYMVNYPDVFLNLFTPDYKGSKIGYSRTAENGWVFPDSIKGEGHVDGQLISGSFWDLEKEIGEDAIYIFHNSRYDVPDGGTLEEVYANFFEATVRAADTLAINNERDYSQPYFQSILKAFDGHKIGLNLLVNYRFQHDNLADVYDNQKVIPVSAEIPTLASPDQIEKVWVNYYISQDPTVQRVLLTKKDNVYSGNIPAPGKDTRISYFFSFENPYSLENVKIERNYFFFSGYDQINLSSFESNQIGLWIAEDSTNTQRGWERKKPNDPRFNPLLSYDQDPVVALNPGPFKSNCWMVPTIWDATSSAFRGLEGTTTITSPTISLPSSTKYPVVSFYYYLYSASLASGRLRLEVSYDNGETWRVLNEYKGTGKTGYTSEKTPKDWTWHREFCYLTKEDHESYDNVKLRFWSKASRADVFTAFVDEVAILNTTDISDIAENTNTANIMVVPNPASNETTINFGQAINNPHITIVNSLGNTVLEMDVQGEATSCPINTFNLSNGVYYVRINSGLKWFTSQFTVVR